MKTLCHPWLSWSSAGGHPPAGSGVEAFALQQTGLGALPALAQAGVRIERLVPGTLGGAHAPTQVLVPPLTSGTQLALTLTFTLALT